MGKSDLISRRRMLSEIEKLKSVFKQESEDFLTGVLLISSALEGVTRAMPDVNETEIRLKTIDEMRDRICMYFANWQLSEMDYDVNYTIGEAINAVAEIAEKLKGVVE